MFDNYTLKARFYPVIILFFPLIIVGFCYSVEFQSLVHLASSVGLVGALTYLFSQLGRDRGKLKEADLWHSWGGAPSTQILRLRDTFLDKFTKQRYHNKLLILCPVTTPPDLNLEVSNPGEMDEIYRAWTKYLITQTREEKAFSLLLKENTSYGFRRNLWGLKPIGISITLLLLVLNYSFWIIKFNSFSPLQFPDSFMFSTIVLILILCFWLFVVSKDWIKISAFSYAERLLESVETL